MEEGYYIYIEDEHCYEKTEYADSFEEAYEIGIRECMDTLSWGEYATFTIENLKTDECIMYDRYGNKM